MATVDPPAEIVRRLAAAGCVEPEQEAVELAAAAPDRATLETWVGRREQGEPLAWLTGAAWFCGRAVRVVPGAYVPRAQTEGLARRAASRLPAGGWALDLCTGVGAIAAHLGAEDPTARVVGIDLDPGAAACARCNGVPTVVGDLAAPLRPDRRWDVVTAVAPYVPTDALRLLPRDVRAHEPRRALDGGADGLALVARVVAVAAQLLVPGGWLLLELGGHQDALLRPTLAAAGFATVAAWPDEEGDLRGLEAQGGSVPWRSAHDPGP